MDFIPNTLVQDHRGEARWRIKGFVSSSPHLKLWLVTDQAPSMERDLILMTLDYGGLDPDDRDFCIQELRHGLHRMVEVLGQGTYNFLPEPVDFFLFTNNHDAMDYGLRQEEPALVLAWPAGWTPNPALNPRTGEIKLGMLRGNIITTLKCLKSLHSNQCVIRELPLDRIRLNPVNYRPYFTGIHTLTRMDDFRGYNPNRAALSPNPLYSAPEVLAPNGNLTPATDIYAVGKLALQLVLGEKYHEYFTERDPFPANIQTLINSLNLADPWPRFLSLCLQPDPAQRFQNATEAEIFLLPKETQEAIDKQRAEREAYSAATSRPQTPPESNRQTPQAPAQRPSAGRPETPWEYRENPQLPDAMLLIWGERLTTLAQLFRYDLVYSDFSDKYNLKPRLFFQSYRGGAVSENPYFKMLQKKYKLTVTPLDGQQDPIGVLNHTLDPYLSNIRNLILVGGADEAGVQCLLQHPQANKWRIHWVRGVGNWQPSTAVDTVTDLAKYIVAKRPQP